MTSAICMKGWSLQKQLFKASHQQIIRMLSVNINNNSYLSILIERPSCLAPELTTIEKKISKTLNEIQFENSLKSNYELLKEDKANDTLYEPFKRQEFLKQTIEDIQDKSEHELKQFKVNPRPMDSDSTSNDQYNSNYLLIKQEESKDVWLPPQDIIHSNESIKQAAKRILNHYFGENFLVLFYGNAPLGFNIIKYTDSVSKKTKKQKVFYVLAKYVNGLTNDAKHRWLSLNEVQKILPQEEYKYVYHILKK